jgi:excisionase family DNA binding protein
LAKYLLTPSDYAALTGLSVWVVRKRLRNGKLAGKRVGRRWRVYVNQERHTRGGESS